MLDDTLVFKGIPYARPPLGPLRFKPAAPLDPDHSVFNAFSFAPAPMQPPFSVAVASTTALGDATCSEDCLYLNVWTPIEPGPHPVFVWIYGGGNVAGATSEPIYDGSNFARSGVVCVTVGYRVGAFGFLELGELLGGEFRGSGNNAIRDQILALQWVQENIGALGGDPSRVTVGGESAGAKNVSTLLATPSARGLFQSAIIESGGGQTVHAVEQANSVTELFMRELRSINSASDALFAASAAELLTAEERTYVAYPRSFAFRSVVDGQTLPDQPLRAVTTGASRDVRVLIGSNRDESLFFLPRALVDLHRTDKAASLPISSHELGQLDLQTMERIEERYVQTFPSMTPFERRFRMLTAEEYWIPTVRLTDAHARSGGATWAYRFERPMHGGPFDGYTPHFSELPFVWKNFDDPFTRMFYPADVPIPELANQMHSAWVSFIKGRQPTARGLPDWPRYSAEGERARETMLLNDRSELVRDPAGNERALWDGIL
jgi:para-nitrobenzyl esterase